MLVKHNFFFAFFVSVGHVCPTVRLVHVRTSHAVTRVLTYPDIKKKHIEFRIEFHIEILMYSG